MGSFDMYDKATMNFAAASPLDETVHGAEGPDFEDPEEWIEFMVEQEIRRVVCLLDDDDLGLFEYSLLDTLEAYFDVVTHAPIEDFGLPGRETLETALEALIEAEKAKEKIVVHCIAGMGRTGIVLAAWLLVRHGLPLDEAIELTEDHADDVSATRRPFDAGEQDVRALLESLTPEG